MEDTKGTGRSSHKGRGSRNGHTRLLASTNYRHVDRCYQMAKHSREKCEPLVKAKKCVFKDNKCTMVRPNDNNRMCCKAMTATCLACSQGVSPSEYCKENPKTVGCKAYIPEKKSPATQDRCYQMAKHSREKCEPLVKAKKCVFKDNKCTMVRPNDNNRMC